MALIWADGFDHYGSASYMTDGAYAAVGGVTGGISTANPRTGTSHYRHLGNSSRIRRVLGSDKAVVGFGYALYMPDLPHTSNLWHMASFNDQNNEAAIDITMTTDGRLRVYRGDSGDGTLLGTSGQVMMAETYQHFETRVFADATDGSVEIRIDGITVLDLTGVNTLGAGLPSQVEWGIFSISLSLTDYDVDDVYAWDDQGDHINDFIGDHRVRLALLTADTVQSDWVRSGGSTDYENIIEIPPDDNASYLTAESAYQASEFEFADCPADVSSIAGVFVVGRMLKTDSGVCQVRMSLISGASEGQGANRAVTQEWTYYGDAIMLDPDTGAPWTPAALDAARFKIERTA